MNKTEENIKSELRKLKNIFEDKENYSSDERRKSLNKYYDLVDLLNDKGDEFKELYVMGSKSSPVGKPGPNRSRQVKMGGGLLENDDERYQYKHGGSHDTETEDQKQMRFLMDVYQRAVDSGQEEDAQDIVRQINELEKKMIEEKAEVSDRMRKADGGNLKEIPEDNKGLAKLPKEVRNKMGYFAEGGNVDDQMSMLMNNEQEPPMESEMPMESDEEMEDNYLDFILDEALSEEEEDMLMSKLEQDEQLSMLFDKVVEVASEFTGSGPVEGPGTGVSDSIPARLSDGEFVFTAKAVEEIGADNLMAMMKEAEAAADERQPARDGGTMKEENNKGSILDTRKDIEEEEPNYTNPLEQPPIYGSGLKR